MLATPIISPNHATPALNLVHAAAITLHHMFWLSREQIPKLSLLAFSSCTSLTSSVGKTHAFWWVKGLDVALSDKGLVVRNVQGLA